MYPNSALSAGQLAIIAVVAVLTLAIWIGGVFVVAREPRRPESRAGVVSLPERPPVTDESGRRAA
jgi:predicted permease